MKANFIMETKEVEADFYLDNTIVESSDHNRLINRDKPDQHPMSAITGLEEAIPTKVSQLENDTGFITQNNVAHLSGDETLTDKTLENSTIKDELVVTGNEKVGERFQISFINGTAQIATNNGLDILPQTNFVTSPTIEADDEFDKLLINQFVSKKQVLQVTSDFVTGDEVDKKIDDALVDFETGGTVDLSGYLSKEEASETYSAKNSSNTFTARNIFNKNVYIDVEDPVTSDESGIILASNNSIISGTNNAIILQDRKDNAGNQITFVNGDTVSVKANSKIEFITDGPVIFARDGLGYDNIDTGNIDNHLSNYATKDDLASKADSETIDDVFDELTTLQETKLNKKLNAFDAGKWLKVDTNGNIVPDTLPSNGGATSDKYGIEADYALHHGILDCPNGLIDYSINNKEIEIQPGVVLQAAGASTQTTIASKLTYEIEETGNIVLFFTRTESESGTIQTGFIEAGEVYYQEEEPISEESSFLAWWSPTVGKWQFKSSHTGNIWREAVATPIANIKAGLVGITSISYIGYRILDNDILVQQSEIESINETIQTINTNVSTLDSQVDDLYTKVENTEAWTFTLEDGTEVTKTVVLGA